MNKSQDFEVYRERYVLTQENIISLLQGKAFNFMVPGKFHIEVVPPNHGITLDYRDWMDIKRLLLLTVDPKFRLDELIERIEGRNK